MPKQLEPLAKFELVVPISNKRKQTSCDYRQLKTFIFQYILVISK